MKQSLAEALNGQREEAHRAVGRGGSHWGTEMEFKNNLTWVWLVASSCLALRCKMARMAQGILSAIRGSQGLPCGYDREVQYCTALLWCLNLRLDLPHKFFFATLSNCTYATCLAMRGTLLLPCDSKTEIAPWPILTLCQAYSDGWTGLASLRACCHCRSHRVWHESMQCVDFNWFHISFHQRPCLCNWATSCTM
jgi:hypothetical protein